MISKGKIVFLILIFLISLTRVDLTEGRQDTPFIQLLTGNINNIPHIAPNGFLKGPELGMPMPLSALNPIQTPTIASLTRLFPPMINPALGGSIMNGAGAAGTLPGPVTVGGIRNNIVMPRSNIFLETMASLNTFMPIGRNIPSPPIIHSYNRPVIYNAFMTQPLINPIMYLIKANPVMTNHTMTSPMMYPTNSYPMMTNPMMTNTLFNGHITNHMINNPFNFQINSPQTANTLKDNNLSIPSEAIPSDFYPQGMLILLKKRLDIPDEIIVNKKGRRGRIEYYTIHGTKTLFTISVPAVFIQYDPFGNRKHFYDPKTGKTITAVGSRIGLTVSGSAPDINLDPYPVPDYAWWYGCSPASAGMMMGYYDWNGYPNIIGANLPDAELTSFSSPFVPGFLTSDYYLFSLYINDPQTLVPPSPTLLCNQAIASAGHIADFWSEPLSLVDPLPDGIPHAFDCLADFMGTSQLNLGVYFDPAAGTTETLSNPDGQTTFWWYDDGTPLTDAIIAADSSIINSSGMYGMTEYARFRGYTATAFNQRPDFWVAVNAPAAINQGFSFLDYKNEISAGRPVLFHVQNGSYEHTVFAFGYFEDLTTTPPTQEVLLRDTWAATTTAFHSMPWGGTYPNSVDPLYPLECYLITSFTIISAPIP